MFRSRTIWEHALRGLLGFGMLAIALLYSSKLGWWTLLPLMGALVMFRGCPTCWTVGLFETVFNKNIGGSCVDGSCAVGPAKK